MRERREGDSCGNTAWGLEKDKKGQCGSAQHAKKEVAGRDAGGGGRARVSFLLDAGTLGSSAARTHKPLVKRAPSPHVADVNPFPHLREEPLPRAVPVTR